MCSCVFSFNRLTGGEETASPSPWSPCLVRQDRQPQGSGLNVHYAVGRNNMERTTVFVCHNLAIPPANPLDLTRLSSAYPGPSQQHTTCFAVELHFQPVSVLTSTSASGYRPSRLDYLTIYL